MNTRRLVLCIFIGLALIFGLAWLLSPSLVWDGAAMREVRLLVVDDTTSAPISGATVRYNNRQVGTTDANGACKWLGGFGAGGTTSLFGRRAIGSLAAKFTS